MTLPKSLEFLTSTRFWAMVVGALALYLKTKGIFGDPEMVLITTIMGGFIVVRTVDRAAEQIGGDAPTVSQDK